MHGIVLLFLDLVWCLYCDDLSHVKREPKTLSIWDFETFGAFITQAGMNNVLTVELAFSGTHPRVDARIHSVLASGSSTSGSSGETSTSRPPPAGEARASTLWRQDKGKRLCRHTVRKQGICPIDRLTRAETSSVVSLMNLCTFLRFAQHTWFACLLWKNNGPLIFVLWFWRTFFLLWWKNVSFYNAVCMD